MAGLDVAACAPDSGVALEAAAEAQLPDAVAALEAAEVLDVGQNVPEPSTLIHQHTAPS